MLVGLTIDRFGVIRVAALTLAAGAPSSGATGFEEGPPLPPHAAKSAALRHTPAMLLTFIYFIPQGRPAIPAACRQGRPFCYAGIAVARHALHSQHIGMAPGFAD